MANLTPADVLSSLERTGMIPVFFHRDPGLSLKVVEACYKAGLKVFEFTNRAENSLEVFRYLARHTAEYGDLILGAGTIYTLEDARKFREAGAKFIVSPALVEEMAEIAVRDNVLWSPGCATISEVYRAHALGAQLVKIFPGNVLGPEFIKAVKSVLPAVKLMPTGGVEPTSENLSSWFGAGVTCVGMGSQLIRKECIANGDYDTLRHEIENAYSLLRAVLNKMGR